MDEKSHVGRPTNEEVASRKKKKVVKYSLITIVSVLLVGGIALFFNRDKIDFSSMMGLSIFKTYKYVVNDYNNSKGGYYLKMTDSKIVKVNSCSISKSKYASCKVFNKGEGILVEAKKSGTVTIKVKVVNKKNKVSTKTIRLKIGSDFKGPSCKVSTYNLKVRRGNSVDVYVTCDEKVFLTSGDKNINNFNTGYSSVVEKGCAKTNFYFADYIDSFHRGVDDYTYIVKLNIPKNACISNDFVISVDPGALKDSFGNLNSNFFSTSIKITK